MEIKVVRGVRDLGLLRGATGPHVVECSDGTKYVVKFADKKSKIVVNEMVGQSLARSLGITTPASALISLETELVATSVDMRNRGIAPGLHYGSQWIENSSNLAETKEPTRARGLELVNGEEVARALCLDNWILADDKNRPENHLLQRVNASFRYYTVDFTHGFTGPTWTVDSIELGTFVRFLMPFLPQAASLVTGISSFQPTLDKIEAFADQEIARTVASVPQEWGLKDDEKESLVAFLQTRRTILRSVIEAGREYFPNWT